MLQLDEAATGFVSFIASRSCQGDDGPNGDAIMQTLQTGPKSGFTVLASLMELHESRGTSAVNARVKLALGASRSQTAHASGAADRRLWGKFCHRVPRRDASVRLAPRWRVPTKAGLEGEGLGRPMGNSRSNCRKLAAQEERIDEDGCGSAGRASNQK
jgi:hypothetical protein